MNVFRGKSHPDARQENITKIKDVCNDGSGSEAHTSIHSFDGDVENLTIEDLAYHELGETKQNRERSLDLIRAWVSSQEHLKGCCRDDAKLRLNDPECKYARMFLLRFLRVNKFSMRKATSMLDSYIKMRCDYPHWYQGLGNWESDSRFMELIECGYIFVAPGRDKLGRKVVVNLAKECDASKYTSSDIMRAMMATIETLFVMDEETQIKGLSYIFYCKGLTLSHTRLFSPMDMARMFTGCDHNIPLRHRAMFIVSMPYGMGSLLNVGKNFLGPVKKRIHVISNVPALLEASNQLLNDPDIMPIDIIGENGKYSALEMAAMWKQHVKDHKEYLQIIDDLIIEKVPEKIKNQEKNNDEVDSNSKKSWFGLWSK